jgi:hypothetical protein
LSTTCQNSATTVMQCQPTVIQCLDASQHTNGHYCLTMRVDYNYSQQKLFPSIPLMDWLLPSNIPGTTTVQLNDPTS